MLWLSQPQALLLTVPSCLALPCSLVPSPSVPCQPSPLHCWACRQLTTFHIHSTGNAREQWWGIAQVRGAHCVLSIFKPHILRKSWKCVFIYFKGASVLSCPWAVYPQGSQIFSRRRTNVPAVFSCGPGCAPVSFQLCTKRCWQAQAAALLATLVPEQHNLPNRSQRSHLFPERLFPFSCILNTWSARVPDVRVTCS